MAEEAHMQHQMAEEAHMQYQMAEEETISKNKITKREHKILMEGERSKLIQEEIDLQNKYQGSEEGNKNRAETLNVSGAKINTQIRNRKISECMESMEYSPLKPNQNMTPDKNLDNQIFQINQILQIMQIRGTRVDKR